MARIPSVKVREVVSTTSIKNWVAVEVTVHGLPQTRPPQRPTRVSGNTSALLVVAPPSGNSYDITWYNYAKGVYLQVSGVATPARSGIDSTVEAEVLSPTNAAVIYDQGPQYVTLPNYNLVYFPSSATTGNMANWYMTDPNSFYNDYCMYYTGYSSYCGGL